MTKPVTGVLDLAAETATALRETSRRAGRAVPQRARPSRCVWGAGGLLPRYCPAHAQVGEPYDMYLAKIVLELIATLCCVSARDTRTLTQQSLDLKAYNALLVLRAWRCCTR